jgi:exodeoxyribonuclease VII large subunit
MRLQRAIGYRLESAGHRLAGARTRLWAERPHLRLKHAQERLERIQHSLGSSIDRRLIERSRQLAALGRALAAVSPLGTLERGYAIVRRVSDRLHHGQLTCQVEDVSDT